MLKTQLPNTITVGQREWKIDTDFRRWIRFGQLFGVPDLTDVEKQNIALLNTYGAIPEDYTAALEGALNFYICGEKEKGDPPSDRLLDWEKDWLCIWADFKIYAHIDLKEISHLHWWEFKALFASLPKESGIKQKISIRGIDLSKIHDPETREEYRKQKRLCSLEDISEAEDFYNYL